MEALLIKFIVALLYGMGYYLFCRYALNVDIDSDVFKVGFALLMLLVPLLVGIDLNIDKLKP